MVKGARAHTHTHHHHRCEDVGTMRTDDEEFFVQLRERACEGERELLYVAAAAAEARKRESTATLDLYKQMARINELMSVLIQ